MASKRTVKNKHQPTSQDFYTLGNTVSASTSNVPQGLPKVPAKRNEPLGFQAPGLSSAKRPKLNSPLQQQIPSPSMSPASQSVIRPVPIIGGVSKASWEDRAIMIPPKDLKDKIFEYENSNLGITDDKIEQLLCGAAKQLREQKSKPEGCLVLTLLYLAKVRPLFFCSNIILEAFSSLIKRDSPFMKRSNNSVVPVLVINLFHYAFHDERDWPEIFIQLYVEDSAGERVWVDHPECKDFVDIIVATFKTKLPPRSMLTTSDVSNPTTKPNETLTISTFGNDDSMGDDASCSSNPSIHSDLSKDIIGSNLSITSRFMEKEEFIIKYVTDFINDHFLRRPNINEIQRNILKLMMTTCGIKNVRLLVAQRLEPWFQSPKLSRAAQDLLLTLCFNCNETDVDTFNLLFKMRLKNKPFINHFILCYKELLKKEGQTFDVVLQTIFSNEISAQTRNLNNYQLITIAFQQKPEHATVVMAQVFFHMIFFRSDDILRILRNTLREVVRQLRYENINFLVFVETLLNTSKEFSEKPEFVQVDEEIRRRAPGIIVDLVSMVILLSVTPNVREAFSTSKGDRREVIRQFQFQVASIERRAVEWIHENMIRRYPIDPVNHRKNFMSCLHKVLMFETVDQYCKLDGFPLENDRNFVFRVTAEVPVFDSTLLNILMMGTTKEIPIEPSEACQCCDFLIQRAASIYSDADLSYPVLLINDYILFIQKLFESCRYSYPENTIFPPNYTPPVMAVINLYWKAWMQIFILGAHSPATFGKYAWANFPTFRLMIEMAITNNFQYPPKSCDDLLNKELQVAQVEKIKILEFEKYLAVNNEINESNSYLLPTLITFDPTSIPRRPSAQFLEELKLKCQKYRLFQLLYQSRDPDFLLTIIEQQQNFVGSQTSLTPMTWLVELVESNENNFGMLPVECLCEFLFGQISEELMTMSVSHDLPKGERLKRKEKRRKQIRLISHFQNVIQQSTPENLNDLLDYLIRRLSSVQPLARLLAYKALCLIVTTNTDEYMLSLDENNIPSLASRESPNWLKEKFVKYLKNESHFQAVSQAMIDALDVETDPILICEYFDFIAQHVQHPNEKLVFRCSSLLINRKKIATFILTYSSDQKLKAKFLDSICKIFFLYADGLLKGEIRRKANETNEVFTKFCNSGKLILINQQILFGMILAASYIEGERSKFQENLAKLLFEENGLKTFEDFEQKVPIKTWPEWLALRLLSSKCSEIITLILNNVTAVDMINFLKYYGLSNIALQKILQSLDKLSAAETRAVKNLSFNKQDILTKLQIHWLRGVNYGHKFAKSHLNLKGETKEEAESAMEVDKPVATLKKKEDKTIADAKVEVFKKEDIQKIFKEKDVKRLIYLTRQISTELDDKNAKTKKLTKLFLSEFNSNVDKIADLIVKGQFNSLFNVIIILVLQDSKHFGFNPDFQAIKKSLLSLQLANGRSIEKTPFWTCFEKFFVKESPKGKKTKQVKKRAYNLKTHDDLNKFLRTFTFTSDDKMQTLTWCEIFKDLAIEKFYNKDTELEDSNASLQPVIFSRDRPYFLSLLLHKSNFSTLNHCIQYLLNDSEESDKLNPSAILDFLTICINSPKLSIGRGADSCKTITYSEDILQLNYEQIRKLIHYVIVENNISKRIDLIIKSCCVNSAKINFIVELLRQYSTEAESNVASELHTRLYLFIPNIELPSNLTDDQLKLIQTEPSFMDKITHNLITSFTFVEPNSPPISPQLFRSWELSILKVASKHPLLFIRQLPMIPALLSGKVSLLNYDAFKSLNLLNIFHKFLKILLLLRPYLWDKHTRGVVQILDLYMDFFMAYYIVPRQRGPNEEIAPLLHKFIALLDDWLKHDTESANNWIKQQKQNLTELAANYHQEQNALKSIISGLASQNQSSLTQSCNIGLMKLRNSQINQENLLKTLAETLKQSNLTPEIAEHLLDEVRNHFMNPSTCDLAFKVSLKALQHNPNLSKSIISTYLRCFDPDTLNVFNLALHYLPEFVVLAEEYRDLIMRKAFESAIAGNTSALPALNDSFKALKSQLGC